MSHLSAGRGPAGVPLAYFLTFTTYGSRLHGDERGSVNRFRRTLGEPGVGLRPALEQHEESRLASGKVILDGKARLAVDEAIRKTCAQAGWPLHALNVRTNHVHVVLTAACPPESALTSIKACPTRRLREVGCYAAGSRLWTRHGSTRYLWTDHDVLDACTYVAEGQGPDITSRTDASGS